MRVNINKISNNPELVECFQDHLLANYQIVTDLSDDEEWLIVKSDIDYVLLWADSFDELINEWKNM